MQSLTEDVSRQTEREKQLQQRYAELIEQLKELSKENNDTEKVYTNGNGNGVEQAADNQADAESSSDN